MKLSSLPQEASRVLCDRTLSDPQGDVFGVKVPEYAELLPLSKGLGLLALTTRQSVSERGCQRGDKLLPGFQPVPDREASGALSLPAFSPISCSLIPLIIPTNALSMRRDSPSVCDTCTLFAAENVRKASRCSTFARMPAAHPTRSTPLL
jgi:hypothetical protein